MDRRKEIENGKAVLGIELGSTRIKAALIGEGGIPLASGSYEWENRFENQVWTYHMEDVWKGLESCYADLKRDVQLKYGVMLRRLGAMGISAMMHGYLVFDAQDRLLTPFRTWRNTMTDRAAERLTQVFHFNIPQRFSAAHLYQAILMKEDHVSSIRFLTTLGGYVHWQLTGEKVLGVGDASGMFPINSGVCDYDERMLGQFRQLVSPCNYPWDIRDILPKVLPAGTLAGKLTQKGAKLLDPTGELEAGILLCPPEGDAGTGMTATNSVAIGTGNVSAGTSIFAMAVMEHGLKKVYPEIDLVTTPEGHPVAMVHCNNCTSDLNAWVLLFQEFSQMLGIKLNSEQLFSELFHKALEGDKDCGGLLAYNYLSGEPVTGMTAGRPLFVRKPDSRFGLSNFMRAHLYSAVATLALGLDILLKEEQVPIQQMYGHGGFFKTKGVGQSVMTSVMNIPVSVMETAGEGGAWGIALLADFMIHKKEKESLAMYLEQKIFAETKGETRKPKEEDVKGFRKFMESYRRGIAVEQAAVEYFK